MPRLKRIRSGGGQDEIITSGGQDEIKTGGGGQDEIKTGGGGPTGKLPRLKRVTG